MVHVSAIYDGIGRVYTKEFELTFRGRQDQVKLHTHSPKRKIKTKYGRGMFAKNL